MFRALRIARARMLTETIAEWELSIIHLAKGTQGYYKRVLRQFASQYNKPLHKVTTKDIKNYLQQLLWHQKKGSANNHLIALRSFFRWVSEEYRLPDPTEKIKRFQRDPPHQPFITKNQYEKILTLATAQQSDVIQLLAMTGLRTAELASLDYENITENFSAIRFTGKGSRERTVPLNATARSILARHVKAETIIKFPKNRKNIYQLCRRAGEKSDIPLAPHMLRRFFASQLVERGVSLLIVSKLLGHASIQTTEIYLHLDSSYLSGATDVLD